MDYEFLTEGPVLFLSDSFRYKYGKLEAFSKQERELIGSLYPEKLQYSASVKCPTVRELDMTPDNMKLCRAHLNATIDKVKPRLVFACGNLAMKMIIKKSGIMNKRGSSYEYRTNSGHSCIVVPIYHPYAVLKEPRHRYLFETDIKNAYEKYVLGKTATGNFTYKVLTEIEDVEILGERLRDSKETLAIDIETTGLNFRTDSIQTIAFASKEQTWVLPLDHKDSPFRKGQPHYAKVWVILRRILENPNNKKVFHNAKFDLKFLINYGIDTKNVWDTKIMHHFINEMAPKSLMDLVKLYFSDELENL
jgi:DNA polymerase-1